MQVLEAVGGELDAQLSREVRGSEEQGAKPWGGGRDLASGEDSARRLGDREQRDGPGRGACGPLELVQS